MMSVKIIKKLMIFVALSGANIAFAEDLQTSKQGIQYQINSMSNEDVKKSKQAIEKWQQQTEALFRQLDSLDIDYSTFNYRQEAFEKISFGIVYSYDTSTGSKRGVPISAVSPGGLMESLGLKTGDIIVSINKLSLKNELQSNENYQWKTALVLTNKLKSLVNNSPLNLEIFRGNKIVLLDGFVNSFRMPALTISTMESVNVLASCGYLRTIQQPKIKQGVYSVEITSIKKENKEIKFRLNRAKLSPGSYVIQVRELITSKYIPNHIPKRFRKKTINLDVKPNKQYTILALLNEETKKDRELYWRTELSVADMACNK